MDNITKAFLDIMDGISAADLEFMTGISIERCDEIVKIYDDYCRNADVKAHINGYGGRS